MFIMFCILKYSEPEKKDTNDEIKETQTKQSNGSKASVDRSHSSRSAERAEIRYDDEVKELLINPNCLTRILLDFVCEQLCIAKEAEIDFCDEYGRLAKINNLNNCEYATEVLKPQLTYVVIVFQRGKSGKYRSIRPVLTKYCKLYADTVFHLKSQFSSSSIYISDKSSSKSFSRYKESRASLRSSDKYRPDSVPSKVGDFRDKFQRGSRSSASHLGLKASKHGLRGKESKRSVSKSAQAALGVGSEVEITAKHSVSSRKSSVHTKAKSSPKEKQAGKSSK